MDAPNLTLPLAFLAGLLSFASPCVLPLVPAYVGYLGGTAVMAGQQDQAQGAGLRTFLHSLFFVLGFAAVFVLLGASATLIGRLLLDYAVALQRVGGVLLIVFGMRLMANEWSRRRWAVVAVLAGALTFVLRSGLLTLGTVEFGGETLVWLEESLVVGLVVLAGAGWDTPRQAILAVAAGILNFIASYDTLLPNLVASILIAAVTVFGNRADLFYAEKKLELKQVQRSGYLRSLVFGVVFAAGWTPCIGPILAGILLVASQLDTVLQGILLLVAYSLGLGIPFLVVGAAFGPLSRWLRKANRYLGAVSIISGALLVLMGILIFSDSLSFLSRYSTFIELGL
jgi:cytochrome c-type biogenesis protein